MLKEQVQKVVIALVVLMTVCGSSVYAAKDCSSDVLVVPSRFTIMQMAFDIVALRDVNLIAYESSATGEAPVLYQWNKTTSAWEDLTIDEYAIGAFMARAPGEMILIGSEGDLPASLISGASQAKKVTRIDSLNVAPVINALNKDMKFTSAEWKVLAERHGLKIKDRNEERRRWGRYGDPNKEKIKKISGDVDSPMPPKACGSSSKTEFDVLEAELDMVEDSSKVSELGLPPEEDEPLAAFEAPKSTEEDLPVVIVERVVVEEVIEDSPEDK